MNDIKKARNIKATTKQKLFGLSNNECYKPNCTNRLITDDKKDILGKIAHIEAASPDGPRFNANMTDDERRDFDNLILLCDKHHIEIDHHPKEYPTELLQEWKLLHEGTDKDALFQYTLKKRYKNTFKSSYDSLNKNNLCLEREIEKPSEIIDVIDRKVSIDKILNRANKSLILTKTSIIKNNFNKYLAHLWGKGEIYQEFEYLIYLSLSKWIKDGLLSLIRDNYYSRDDKLITLDIKENNQKILFLFDDIDILNYEKKEILLDEISQLNLIYYSFTTLPKRNFLNEFKFDECFNLSFLRSVECIVKRDSFSYKEKIFNYFQNELIVNNNDFSIDIDKKLYSKNIEEDITFDIVIEIIFGSIFPTKIIIKCFNENEELSLETIQNFYNKKDEVNAERVCIVSSNIFENNIFRYAEKNKIGLLRIDDISSEWVLQRSPSSLLSWKEEKLNQKSIKEAFQSKINNTNYQNCYALSNEQYTNSLSRFMINLLSNNKEKEMNDFLLSLENNKFRNNYDKVLFINDKTMNDIVDNLLFKISYKDGIVDLEKISSLLKEEHNLEILYNEALNEDVLGEIDFQKNLIFIDNHQCETLARMRFTVAHEIGHFLLGHARYMYKEQYTKNHEENFGNKLTIDREDIIRMEWQSDYFASSLLLPIDSFNESVLLLFEEYDVKDRGFGQFFLDNQRCNIEIFLKITSRLMQKYKVSRRVIEIKLKKLNILHKKNTYGLLQNINQEVKNKKISWNLDD